MTENAVLMSHMLQSNINRPSESLAISPSIAFLHHDVQNCAVKELLSPNDKVFASPESTLQRHT
jgi:hypothetical protein